MHLIQNQHHTEINSKPSSSSFLSVLLSTILKHHLSWAYMWAFKLGIYVAIK